MHYRWRIAQGLEHCRALGCDYAGPALTFDHIHPRSAGGSINLANTAILCVPHQLAKADSTEPPWCDLPSLAAEEAAAPPERRWSELPVPPETAHRVRESKQRRRARLAQITGAGQPWRNTALADQLASLNLEERSG